MNNKIKIIEKNKSTVSTTKQLNVNKDKFQYFFFTLTNLQTGSV